MTRRGLGLGRAALACAALLAGGEASAQSLGVSPVSLQTAPGQAVTTLTLTNQGDRPTAIQIRAFAWNHDSGADELIPSDRLIVSPPISTIAPSGTQVVRLMLRYDHRHGHFLTMRFCQGTKADRPLPVIQPPAERPRWALNGRFRFVWRARFPDHATEPPPKRLSRDEQF